MHKIRSHLRNLVAWLSGPQPLFFLLPYWMGLLIVGTIAQKSLGIYKATELYFHSWLVPAGPLFLPGGVTVLMALFINLLVHFLLKSEWRLLRMGVTLTHLAVLVLISGGIVSYWQKDDWSMTLALGQSSNTLQSYYTRELLVQQNDKVLARWPSDTFHTGKSLQKNNVTVRIEDIHANTEWIPDGKNKFRLEDVAAKTEDEANHLGLDIVVNGQKIRLTEFAQKPVQIGDGLEISLRRQQKKLPFKIQLLEASQTLHPGSEQVQSYKSFVAVKDGNSTWPAAIEMNQPLRYKNYTFYQSAFLSQKGQGDRVVFAVSRNVAWLFPYAAGLLLMCGLAWHVWVRRDA